jgi:hypothetical protein
MRHATGRLLRLPSFNWQVCAKNMRLVDGRQVKRKFVRGSTGCLECACGYTCGTVKALQRHFNHAATPKCRPLEARDLGSSAPQRHSQTTSTPPAREEPQAKLESQDADAEHKFPWLIGFAIISSGLMIWMLSTAAVVIWRDHTSRPAATAQPPDHKTCLLWAPSWKAKGIARVMKHHR